MRVNLDGLDFDRRVENTIFSRKKITHQTHFFPLYDEKSRAEKKNLVEAVAAVPDKNRKLYVGKWDTNGLSRKTAISTPERSMKIIFFVPFFARPLIND